MEKMSPGVKSTMKEQPSKEFNLSGELDRPNLSHVDGRGRIAEDRVCAARGERFSFARVKLDFLINLCRIMSMMNFSPVSL